MQTEGTAFFPDLSPRSGVYVADGYGIRVRVERKHLVISDGIGRARRERRFSRAASGLKRVVVFGQTGYVSLEALRWMADVGIGFVQIDGSGRVVACSGLSESDKPALRRAQALVVSTPTGIEIVRGLLADKLTGQAAVVRQIASNDSFLHEIDRAHRSLQKIRRLDALMMAEAQAALAYWSAWEPVPVHFARRDVARVPEHWRMFGKRRSLISGHQRLASNPANALLNYLYALLEGEARMACLAIGLDPGLGILHADQWSRDSLALDVMEAVRPDVDHYVLKVLTSRAFRASDFHETRQGVCRILAPLTHELAATLPAWRRAVAPVTERVARQIAAMPGARVGRVATPLTGSNRSQARPVVRHAKERKPKTAQPERRCGECGATLKSRNARYCEACAPERERLRRESFTAAGLAALEKLRAEGRDASKRPQARAKMSASLRARRREELEWDALHPERPSPEEFRRDVLPKIQGVSLGSLARATGLSVQHCSHIRRGIKIPHARHWELLLSAVDS